MIDTNEVKSSSKGRRRMAREREAGLPMSNGDERPVAVVVKPKSKVSLVVDMLQSAVGASLDELVAATGWLPHTTRAALTGLRKKGHVITKDKVDGVTRYAIAPEVPE